MSRWSWVCDSCHEGRPAANRPERDLRALEHIRACQPRLHTYAMRERGREVHIWGYNPPGLPGYWGLETDTC